MSVLRWLSHVRTMYRVVHGSAKITHWVMWKSLQCIARALGQMHPLYDVCKELLYMSLQWYPETYWESFKNQFKAIEIRRRNNSLTSEWVVISTTKVGVELEPSAPPPSPPRVRIYNDMADIITQNHPQLAPLSVEDDDIHPHVHNR